MNLLAGTEQVPTTGLTLVTHKNVTDFSPLSGFSTTVGRFRPFGFRRVSRGVIRLLTVGSDGLSDGIHTDGLGSLPDVMPYNPGRPPVPLPGGVLVSMHYDQSSDEAALLRITAPDTSGGHPPTEIYHGEAPLLLGGRVFQLLAQRVGSISLATPGEVQIFPEPELGLFPISPRLIGGV
jgi:hypothetical protein